MRKNYGPGLHAGAQGLQAPGFRAPAPQGMRVKNWLPLSVPLHPCFMEPGSDEEAEMDSARPPLPGASW